MYPYTLLEDKEREDTQTEWNECQYSKLPLQQGLNKICKENIFKYAVHRIEFYIYVNKNCVSQGWQLIAYATQVRSALVWNGC